MLIDKIDELIAINRKARNVERVRALQMIKTVLVNEQKSGNPYNDGVEARLLSNMVKQYKKSIAACAEGKTKSAEELVEQYTQELSIIQEFAPKEVNEKEITAFIDAEIKTSDHPLTMKELMPKTMKQFPTAEGKTVSTLVKKALGC